MKIPALVLSAALVLTLGACSYEPEPTPSPTVTVSNELHQKPAKTQTPEPIVEFPVVAPTPTPEPVAPVAAPKAPEQPQAPAVPAKPVEAPKPALTGTQWAYDVAARHGVVVPVPMSVEPLGDCGSAGASGCTRNYVDSKTGKFISSAFIRISPAVVGTAAGEFTVLHEIGHAYGNLSECAADQFAYAHGGSGFRDKYC